MNKNSKVFTFFDWVWRLMVLNLLVIVFSIGVITIMPAISAAFKTIKDTRENYNSKIFKPFLENFISAFPLVEKTFICLNVVVKRLSISFVAISTSTFF